MANTSDVQGKAVLIIDDEIDFCLLMQFYLRKKNCTVDYTQNLTDGLELIELKRPEIIIADTKVTDDVEEKLNNKIASIHNYTPSVFFNANSSFQPREDQGTLLDEIKKWIQWIRDKFK